MDLIHSASIRIIRDRSFDQHSVNLFRGNQSNQYLGVSSDIVNESTLHQKQHLLVCNFMLYTFFPGLYR